MIELRIARDQSAKNFIKETIKNDPEKVREFMKDPEIVESIMREVMRGGDDEETE